MSETERAAAGYRPEQPIEMGPPFQWPPRPAALLKWLFGFPGYLWPYTVMFVGIGWVAWQFLTPDLARMRTFAPDWIALIFLRNLALLVVFVSIWHVRLYSRKAQGTQYKYNSDWLAVRNAGFTFGTQLRDNVFWNVCSGVPIWTAYEAVGFWLLANGWLPTVSWQTHPIYCVALILLTPVWLQTHFYATHRLIHSRLLYKHVHSVHHRNVNVGPWSGLAMHPLEHLIYFSGTALFWLIPASPLHWMNALTTYALGPSTQHHGFDRVVLGEKTTFNTNHYMHYLHHKHVRVNYGNGGVPPLDKWLGTFHDGSDAAHEAMKSRMRARALRSRDAKKGV